MVVKLVNRQNTQIYWPSSEVVLAHLEATEDCHAKEREIDLVDRHAKPDKGRAVLKKCWLDRDR